MTSVHDVAKFFLTLSEPDEGDFVSHLKLQKLCYYAQGFHLAIHDKALFRDAIMAWEHGPVIVALYHTYKGFGAAGIPVPTDLDLSAMAEHRALLQDVWDTYGQFSAWKLRNMTHAEPPWVNTPRDSVISIDLMRDYFKTQLK